MEPLPPQAASTDTAAPIVAAEPRARTLAPVNAVHSNFESVRETVAAAVVAPRFDAAYLQNPPPPYPALARRLGEHGRVLLRVLVSAAGLADEVELKASSGSERLDRAAQDAVKHWRFVPALQGDRPIPAWVVVPISFSLS
jgi:protein TonB